MSKKNTTPRIPHRRLLLLVAAAVALPGASLAASDMSQEAGAEIQAGEIPQAQLPGTTGEQEDSHSYRDKRRKRARKKTVVVRGRGRRGQAYKARVRMRTRNQRRRNVVVHRVTPPTVIVHTNTRSSGYAAPRRTPQRIAPAPRPSTPGSARQKSWLHAGGGFGSVAGAMGDGESEAAGRGVFGAGGQSRFIYGGGELALTSSETEKIDITAAGFVGLTLPNAPFQPLVGVRAGAGHHTTQDNELSPHLVVGPQLGFMARRPGSRQGIRVMADVGFDYGIEEKRVSPEFFLTFSAVF